MPKKYCDDCGITHSPLMCFNKPRKRIRAESKKHWNRRQETSREWFEKNPPSSKGTWVCYLQISKDCPVTLTRSTIQLEHVKSKARHPELKFNIDNLRPACAACNKLKASMSVKEAKEKYGTIAL